MRQAAATVDVRQQLDKGKAALTALNSSVVARLSHVAAAAVSDAAQAEDKLHLLQAQLESTKETAACELESWERRGLALKAEAETLTSQAAEETSRLAAELSAVETQRSMMSRTFADEAGATVSVLRDGAAQIAAAQVEVGELRAEVEHLEAELRAVAHERQLLQEEHHEVAEKQQQADEALRKALQDNAAVRQQMEAQRVESQSASEAALREADSSAAAALRAAAEVAEAELNKVEETLDAMEKELAESRARCSQLHLHEASLQRDKASLERERSLWKAQHELAQTLHAEARDDINDSRASWAEEVRSLKDQIVEATRKKDLLDAKLQDTKVAAEASQTEALQVVVEARRKAQLFESQIDEVRGLCAPVQKALQRQAVAFASAQKEVEERRSQSLQASGTMRMELELLQAERMKERAALEAKLTFERERMLQAQAANRRRAADLATNGDTALRDREAGSVLALGDVSLASIQDTGTVVRRSCQDEEAILAETTAEMERRQQAVDLAERENQRLKQLRLANSSAQAEIAESLERMQRRTEQLRRDIGGHRGSAEQTF